GGAGQRPEAAPARPIGPAGAGAGRPDADWGAAVGSGPAALTRRVTKDRIRAGHVATSWTARRIIHPHGLIWRRVCRPPSDPQPPHTYSAGPHALPHFHQESRSPDGHCFYETEKRKARRRP